LDNFINNYISDCTPLGEVIMRYNNSKQTFEYFSNNSIPYRYLETVCRKYVTTYWCKPIFIDIEEELMTSNNKSNNELSKSPTDDNSENSKKNFAKFKEYNKINNQNIKHIDNRQPQMSSKQNVVKNINKNMLKTKINNYTREGRLSDCKFLKHIDKKPTKLSFADFKRIHKKT
jgi:hypothetical protein